LKKIIKNKKKGFFSIIPSVVKLFAEMATYLDEFEGNLGMNYL
jgi:hypothetical protein